MPAAVIWECSLLARAGRVNLRRTVRQFFDDLFSNPVYQPLDLSPEQVFLADEMRFNRDPFDALICAAARAMDLPLITRDADIRGKRVLHLQCHIGRDTLCLVRRGATVTGLDFSSAALDVARRCRMRPA